MSTEKCKFNLVYFLSEGPPNDNGLALSDNKPFVEKNASAHFNNIELYTPRKMIELGLSNYVKDYIHQGLVTMNAGMTRIGNCAWRPKIMLLELEKMNDGDILIYRDSNIKKWGGTIGDYTNVREIAMKCLEGCEFDFFVPRESENLQLKQLAKTNIIRELGEDHPFTYDFPNILSGNLTVVRKSAISIELLTEWDSACQVEQWIDIHKYGNLHPAFMWSCPEQSILGIIISNWVRNRKHNIPLKYPIIGFEHRFINKLRTFENYDYLKHIKPRIAVLLCGIHYMNNYTENIGIRNLTIDYRDYVTNIKTYVYEYYEKQGYTIDTFICTNDSPLLPDLISIYNPVKYEVSEKKRIDKINAGLKMVNDHIATNNVTYDLICLTRFDIYFLQYLTNINKSSINIISVLESKSVIDDNFYIFPQSLLNDMLTIFTSLDSNNNMALHYLQNTFETFFPINFIKNENAGWKQLSTYKLHISAYKNV